MALREVYKPKDITEVLQLLDKYKDKGKIIAGGTDLIIDLKERAIDPEVLIDIATLEELKGIAFKGSYIEIGAATTFAEMMDHVITKEKTPALVKAARSIGSPQIRNTATIGGNICNASPAADMLPVLLALDASIILKDLEGEKTILLEQVLKGKGKIDIERNQLLSYVKFKAPVDGEGLSFEKLGFRKALAIAKIALGVFVEVENNKCKEIRIGSGAIHNRAIRESKIEDYFRGKILSDAVIEEGSELFQEEVRERLINRSSGEFKREAIKGIFTTAMKTALSTIKS
ncbi:MAG: xanthine dehydrogenase family protein subunit M [Clostridiaceae bacterium]|nr:xanthine dehydrogenase family protein subunit M [Clostridiaceae bacterium]